MAVKKILLVGGTHGNELTGIHLLRRWAQAPLEIARSGLEVTTLFANQPAWADNRRYLDADLNRQFSSSDLDNPAITHSEGLVAKAIAKSLGPKQQPQLDFIIDMHTTTANMGVTLVLNSDCVWAVQAAAYVRQQMPEVFVMSKTTDRLDDTFLVSMGRERGIIVEVGPVPQGVLQGQVFEQTRLAVGHILDFLSNMDAGVALPPVLETFEYDAKVVYPVDASGAIAGMIHPELQGRDFLPLAPGDPIFLLQSGEVIAYDGLPGRVACFINEAAYYDQNHAFSLLTPAVLQVKA